MVYSKHNFSYEPTIEDFLRLKHCGIFKENGLKDYLVSIGVCHYPTIYFKVDAQYENVSTDSKDYDPDYPFRLKSMHIYLGSDDKYYSWESDELDEPGFYGGLIDYFEGKGYPIGTFMQQGGSDDAQKIDQFFQAMIRDKFKMYGFKFIEPNTQELAEKLGEKLQLDTFDKYSVNGKHAISLCRTHSKVLGVQYSGRANEMYLYRMWHDWVYEGNEPHYVECVRPDTETAKAFMEARKIRECWYGGTPWLLDREYTAEEVKHYSREEKRLEQMHLDMRDIIVTDNRGKMGLKDVCGKILVEPMFDDIPERYTCFDRPMLIPVVQDGKYYLYHHKDKKMMTRGYDLIYRYFGTNIAYFVAVERGKKGLLDGYDGHVLTPIDLDEIYDTHDADSCVPIEKDGKFGFYWNDSYAEPIYDKVRYASEEYLQVWKDGQQGWIDGDGKFTTDEDEACFGSWYDLEK